MTIAELGEKNITELSRIARSLLGRGRLPVRLTPPAYHACSLA